MTIELALIILYIFLGFIVALILAIFFQKANNARLSARHNAARDFIMQRYFDHEKVKMPVSSRFFFNAFYEVETQIQIEPEIRQQIIDDIDQPMFDYLMKTLCQNHSKYPTWVFALIKNHFPYLKSFIMTYWNCHDEIVRKLFIYLSGSLYDADLKTYAAQVSENETLDLPFRLQAMDALANNYPEILASDYYKHHP